MITSTINRLFYSGTRSMPSEFAKQRSKSINKLVTYSCHISFLKACRDHDIIPRGLRLKNPLKDAKSQMTIHSASLKLVKNRLQHFRKSFHQQKVMLDTTLLELKLNDEYYDKLLKLNKMKTSAIHKKSLTKQAKKFSSLISEFNLPYLSPYQQLQSFNINVSTISGPLKYTTPSIKPEDTKRTVINLSDTSLEPNETELLSLGLKFCPTDLRPNTATIASNPPIEHLIRL